MADSYNSVSSAFFINNLTTEWNLNKILNHKECSYLNYDDNKIRWDGGFEELKNFVERVVNLHGKWSSPGGSSKKFTCSSPDLTITWYQGKRNTLILHGQASSTLADIFTEIGKKSIYCDAREERSLRSDKDQTVIVCLSDDTLGGKSLGDNSGESTLKSVDSIACEISTHSLESEMSERSSQVRSNLPHCNTVLKRDCDCQCRLLAAELEGIKLDLVIMQKNIESNINVVNNDEVTKLNRDLRSERQKSKRLEAENKRLEADMTILVRGRNNEVNDLNNIIVSLENKVKTIEALNDSLKTTISDESTIHIQNNHNVKANVGSKLNQHDNNYVNPKTNYTPDDIRTVKPSTTSECLQLKHHQSNGKITNDHDKNITTTPTNKTIPGWIGKLPLIETQESLDRNVIENNNTNVVTHYKGNNKKPNKFRATSELTFLSSHDHLNGVQLHYLHPQKTNYFRKCFRNRPPQVRSSNRCLDHSHLPWFRYPLQSKEPDWINHLDLVHRLTC